MYFAAGNQEKTTEDVVHLALALMESSGLILSNSIP